MVCKPLCLNRFELAETRGQFPQVCWAAATDYDPKWVYHGCLIGNAPDAARTYHWSTVATGNYAPDGTGKIFGGAVPDNPWTECDYALGLMCGAGKAAGHSGGGPFSVNTIYHFPDASDPITEASFAGGTAESLAEFQ